LRSTAVVEIPEGHKAILNTALLKSCVKVSSEDVKLVIGYKYVQLLCVVLVN